MNDDKNTNGFRFYQEFENELKKQGFIEYKGSAKTGGYSVKRKKG